MFLLTSSKAARDQRLMRELQEQFMADSKKLIEAHRFRQTDPDPLAYVPMRRLLSNDEDRLEQLGLPHANAAELRRERRRAFVGYLRLLKRDCRNAFYDSVDCDVARGDADFAEFIRRRFLREISLVRLRWLAWKHLFGSKIDGALIERLVNSALNEPPRQAV